jgi:hypothetical protein
MAVDKADFEIDPRNGGVSHAGVRNTVIAFIAHRIKPKLIIEYGFGQGLYGIGLRGNGFDGTLFGVDAWAPAIPRVHRYGGVYDMLTCADVQAYEMMTPFSGPGVLTICGDMIEHLEKEKAVWLMRRLAARDSIIVTPTFYNPQVAIAGNPYEEHRCFITREEFEADGWALLVNGEYTAQMIEISVDGKQTLKQYPGLVEAFLSPPLADRVWR